MDGWGVEVVTWGTITYDDILRDPAAPYWAQELARILPTKDSVDVLNALEVLTQAAQAEWDRVRSGGAR